jgi:hypothetical protein
MQCLRSDRGSLTSSRVTRNGGAASQAEKKSVDINVFIRYRPRQRINTLIIKTKKQRPARR